VTGSPSPSAFVAVAVRTSPVFGLAVSSATVAVGLWLTPTCAVSVAAALVAVPSSTVTETSIVSPSSPFPGCERSSVGPVAPATTTPFTFQT